MTGRWTTDGIPWTETSIAVLQQVSEIEEPFDVGSIAPASEYRTGESWASQ